MKKIVTSIFLVVTLLISFTACSEDDTKTMGPEQISMLSDTMLAIGSAANTSLPSSKAAGPQTIDYTDPAGKFTVSGTYTEDGDTKALTVTITFNNYSSSGVTLSGTINFDLSAVTTPDTITGNIKYIGNLTVIYDNQSYQFGLNIMASTVDASSYKKTSLSGSVSINGTKYTCSMSGTESKP